MRKLNLIILSLTAFSIKAQQWVIDEIADEQESSESIPGWLILLLVLIGFFVYKHSQKKEKKRLKNEPKKDKWKKNSN